jgi:hypothetical protein
MAKGKSCPSASRRCSITSSISDLKIFHMPASASDFRASKPYFPAAAAMISHHSFLVFRFRFTKKPDKNFLPNPCFNRSTVYHYKHQVEGRVMDVIVINGHWILLTKTKSTTLFQK